MLGLRWMCMHLWMNLIKRTIDIQEEEKKSANLCTKSMESCPLVIYMYHIFWQSSIQRGRHTQLCIITSLKWIIQICSNFYCWVCNLIAFYTHPIHNVVWGNFPFNTYNNMKIIISPKTNAMINQLFSNFFLGLEFTTIYSKNMNIITD